MKVGLKMTNESGKKMNKEEEEKKKKDREKEAQIALDAANQAAINTAIAVTILGGG